MNLRQVHLDIVALRQLSYNHFRNEPLLSIGTMLKTLEISAASADFFLVELEVSVVN